MGSQRIGGATGAENVVSTTCSSHCGGGCLLKVHVERGLITRIETDDGEEPQLRACLRGRAYRQRVYAPDRLKYPMRRVGARGEGKFQRILWDEALDTVAKELKRVRDIYGPAAILHLASAGDQGLLHDSPRRIGRLLCLLGGYTQPWGVFSCEGLILAELATYGPVAGRSANSHDDLLNSRLIILWGWDPATTVSHTNTSWYLVQAREVGIKIVSIDPRYTESAATFAHQWIPIRPGTDAAMLVAMANVIVTEKLQDQNFIDSYTVGFEAFRDYVLGIEDGVPKTPRWAEAITGVPSVTIQKLAEEYATTKPAALMAGFAPGRTAYGEQFHRAAITLAAMTGNIGIAGGSAAGPIYGPGPFLKWGSGMKMPKNPVDVAGPMRGGKLLNRRAYMLGRGTLNLHRVTDAILKGRAGGYPAEYKLLYVQSADFLNQSMNTNRIARAFEKLDFITVEEQFMTPTAKYADILLPVTTFLERNDVVIGLAIPPFYGYRSRVIEPLYEAKSPLEIATELAHRLGLADYSEKTEDEWLTQLLAGTDVPDHDLLKKDGVHKTRQHSPFVAFQEELGDSAGKCFPTPSGKIEIYSRILADMEKAELPPIPKYMETWESMNDPLATKFPLQLITTHFRRRAHTQFDNLPWLAELEPQAMKINTRDAEARGIQDGDIVKVFNDRGSMITVAKVTERIMPGVVDVPQGGWYNPDDSGVDRGGCANVLTKDEPSPGGALPSNTALVQVEKAWGQAVVQVRGSYPQSY
jgi:anaerobic dimethyl sulfoxide reductase subunit A